MSKPWAVILAAGEGTRMKSAIPKVLHRICGQPMIRYVTEAVAPLVEEQLVVIGHGGELVQSELGDAVSYAWQKQQLGTGHALMQSLSLLPARGETLVLCGDTPLLRTATLQELIRQKRESDAVILTAEPPETEGYGRIVRNSKGEVLRIVEEKEADPAEKKIGEVNTGCYIFSNELLHQYLPLLDNNNVKGEYYLTDLIMLLVDRGYKVTACRLEDYREAQGVNDRLQLSFAAGIVRKRINEKLMKEGVTIIDPESTYIDLGVEIGADTTIYPQTVIEGKSKLGSGCVVGPAAHLMDALLEDNVVCRASVLWECSVASGAQIGPFAYLRPGTKIGPGVKIGDFVEIKNSYIGDNSKVPHLAYVGDATVGPGVNLGAGTIVVNYDGRKKHRTIIEEGAFVGCNSNLIAPLTVGRGSFIAAGSTVTRDVPPEALLLARTPEEIKKGVAPYLLGNKSKKEKEKKKEKGV